MKKMPVARIILVISMLIIAALAAVAVKDAIDRRNPQYAIPQITVTADAAPVAVLTAQYKWEFMLGGSAELDEGAIEELSIPETNLEGGELIVIDFSVKPESLRMERTSAYTYDFSDIDETDLTVPYESGGYIYRISADFDYGSVVWYFYIVV